MPPALRGPGLAGAATLLAAAVTAVVLVGFSLVSFPAYGNSNVLRALTVVGQTAAVALVAAGYNAGPGRSARWLRDFGDLRDEGTDPVDWVEMIPFDETRNYVMRVAEAMRALGVV